MGFDQGLVGTFTTEIENRSRNSILLGPKSQPLAQEYQVQFRKDIQVIKKMWEGKQPRRWEASHVPSQDGNGLVPICPEALKLEANSKH